MPRDSMPSFQASNHLTTVLLTTATHAEMTPVARRLGLRRNHAIYLASKKDHASTHRMRLIGQVTGIGCKHMTSVLPHAIQTHHPTHLIHFGFAGAVDPALKTGDLLELTHVINTGGGVLLVRPDFESTNAKPLKPLLTVDHLVSSVEEKRTLYQAFDAVAVDMESFAVVNIAKEQGLPVSLVRAISDDAQTVLPAQAANWISREGETRSSAVAWSLAKNPRLIPALSSLKQASQQAGDAIASRVAELIRHLG